MKKLYLNKYKILLIGITLLQMISFISLSQNFLTGQVQDGEIKGPLYLANIFLSNTTKGTISDNNGKFILEDVPSGYYDLVISCIGYETLKLKINTKSKNSYRIILKPAENQLSEFNVKAKKSKKWYVYLKLFESHFIGNSDNASECKIINPDVLIFSDSSDHFNAFAKDLLVVENKGLGYRIKYALVRFVFYANESKTTYEGYPVFEKLVPANEKQRKQWVENRGKAYLGSVRHFMRSVYSSSLLNNRFVVQKIDQKIDKSGRPRLMRLHGEDVKIRPAPADSIVRIILPDTLDFKHLVVNEVTADGRKTISFKGPIQVTYLGESESIQYQKMNDPPEYGYRKTPQVSIIHMSVPAVTLEPDGHFYDPLGIVFELYWSWELMAEMLPYDFDISKDG